MEQPVSRRERERQARRHTMLDAARVVIAEKGFKAATLDEIAQRAEFGKGTLYNYFPNGKDEMLFAILDEVYADLHGISVDAFETDDQTNFGERLFRYVASFLRYFMHQRDLFVIVMKEANRIAFSDEEVKTGYFKDNFKLLISVLKPAIKQAMDAGQLKEYPPDSVAHMILGNVHGFLRYNCLDGIVQGMTEEEKDAETVRAAAFLCGILLNGMAVKETVVSPNGKDRVE